MTFSDDGPVKWLSPEAIAAGTFSTARLLRRFRFHLGVARSRPIRSLVRSLVRHNSDVWAYGVALWELATGKKPFADLSGAPVSPLHPHLA